MTVSPVINELPTRDPIVGELVYLRSRTWLVEEVIPSASPGQSSIVRLACADDDAQGQDLEVFWEYEIDRRVLEEEGWKDLATRGFDIPRQFAAFLHTLRWNCSTATDPNIFQAPFRAGAVVGWLRRWLLPERSEGAVLAAICSKFLCRAFCVRGTSYPRIGRPANALDRPHSGWMRVVSVL